MCCAAKSLAVSPVPPAPRRASAQRRAPVRAAHLCRGRGGRGCRCHMAVRPAVAQSHPVPPRILHLPAPQPAHSPQPPQGPPCSF